MTNSEVIKYLEALKRKVDIHYAKLLNELDYSDFINNKASQYTTSIIEEINAIYTVIKLINKYSEKED